MKSNQKLLITLTLLWLLSVAFRFLFYHEINDNLWVFSWLVDGVLVLGGAILAIALLCLKQRKAIGIALAMVVVIGLAWFSPIGWKTGTLFRMWRLESTYEKEIVRIMALDDEALESFETFAEIEPGPPRRIAFSWGGIIDNWSGIVYDPSGEVLKAQQFKDDWSNWDDPELSAIKSLFGGDLRNARHLWGPWYYCFFT